MSECYMYANDFIKYVVMSKNNKVIINIKMTVKCNYCNWDGFEEEVTLATIEIDNEGINVKNRISPAFNINVSKVMSEVIEKLGASKYSECRELAIKILSKNHSL